MEDDDLDIIEFDDIPPSPYDDADIVEQDEGDGSEDYVIERGEES